MCLRSHFLFLTERKLPPMSIIIIATHNASQLITIMFSAGEMKRLLAVKFSEEGSNQREVEESAWIRIFLTSVPEFIKGYNNISTSSWFIHFPLQKDILAVA